SKMATTPEKLATVTTPKGEYLAFRRKERGKPTIKLLADAIPQAVLGIGWPRSMYWESKTGPHFIRPIRSLLALFGGRGIPCAIGDVKAGNITFGHRRLGKSKVRVSDVASYREALQKNYVVLEPAERRNRVVEGIGRVLASENGFRVKGDKGLLET